MFRQKIFVQNVFKTNDKFSRIKECLNEKLCNQKNINQNNNKKVFDQIFFDQ